MEVLPFNELLYQTDGQTKEGYFGARSQSLAW